MIENLIIFARRLFKHKHRFARGTEHQKILMVDLQHATVSQVKNDGLPVGPNGFDVLNSHARKTLTDVPSVFHNDPRSKTSGTAFAGQTRAREATEPFGSVLRARRDLFSVLPASCRQNETMPDRKTCRRDAGSTLERPHEAPLKTHALSLAISAFGIRHSGSRLRAGWTLIESIAVMAVIAVLAATIAPTIIRRVDRAAWTKETADLNDINDTFTQSILRTKTIPNHTTWASAVASQMSLPISAISTNARRYARAFYMDQNLDINGSGLPYTQTTNGTAKPNNARVMIVSSLAGALPLPSGLLSTSDFDPIWNAADGAKPSTWTTWTGTGDDLRIKKINLEPLFYQLILINHDPTNAPKAPFSIDRVATNTVASGPNGWNKYYLEGSDLWLLDSASPPNLRTRYLLRRNISFIFESGSWRGQIQGGETFSDTNGQTASSFLQLATAFYNAPVNPNAGGGASPASVLITMYTFMFDYVFWATQCPNFDWHSQDGNATPSNLPEYRMLNDMGQTGGGCSIDKFSGSNGLLH